MKKKNIITISIIILILLCLVIASIVYLRNIQNLINKNTMQNLGELTKQEAVKIENKLEEDMRILNNISNQVLNNNITDENKIFEIYNQNEGKNNFTRMAIMHKYGKTITSDGETVDLSEDIEYFFANNQLQISRSRKSKVDMQEINIYSKKVNDIVLMLIVETAEYERLFANSIYNGNGYEYIITEAGELIANSANFENTKNIYTGLKENIQSESEIIDNIEKNIRNHISGQEKILINGQNYYISYSNIDINGWNLLIITPGNVVAEGLNKVLNLTFIISLSFIAIIILVSVYIITLNIRKNKELYKLAYIDPITKLGNYYYFCMEGQKIIDSNKKLTKYILTVDIEKFKVFNNHYGHNTGNKVLVQIGKKLNNVLKQYNPIVCRFSKDTFEILLITNDNINLIAKQIFKEVSTVNIEDKSYLLYPVIGIYKIKENDTILEAIDKATIAHDTIIGDYNKQYAIFDEKIEKQLLEEHQIEEIMEEALKNEEFEIYYQPKVSLHDQNKILAEALVRWKRNGEIIPPGKFIPLFEKNKFIVKLDSYIFENVCKDMAKWQKNLKISPIVSINVSKENFSSMDFIEKYVKIAKKYDISLKHIELEITESASADSNINLVEVMNKIKDKGFKLSLDDFGTGYSSLNMLQDMPIDVLKIDKSFVDKIGTNNDKIDLISYIINMAKELNIQTVAEGVEYKTQVDYLKSQGCDIIQGYYYSKPLTKHDFEIYINEKLSKS